MMPARHAAFRYDLCLFASFHFTLMSPISSDAPPYAIFADIDFALLPHSAQIEDGGSAICSAAGALIMQ